jgi:putative membrane protein
VIVWSHWHNEPLLIGTLLAVAWAYALAVGPWRFRFAASGNTPFPRHEALRFTLALLIFYAAVGSPLDQLGERFLLSAHMLQHMLIIYVVAPLLYASAPTWLIDALLARPRIRALARPLTHPVVAAVFFALVLSFWHAPAAYDYALRHRLVHVVQHLSFLGAALLLWWPLLNRSRVLPRLPPGPQILYLVGSGALQMPLLAFLTFSRTVLYPTYEFAPRLLDLTPRDDQILGGALMGVGGTFITLGLIARAFFRWSREAAAGDLATRPS